MGFVNYIKMLYKKNTFEEKKIHIKEDRVSRERESEDWRHIPLSDLLCIDSLKLEIKSVIIDRGLYTIYE